MKGSMALQKSTTPCGGPPATMKPLVFQNKGKERVQLTNAKRISTETDIEVDLTEVYFLIMHFLSAGPCHRTYGQLWNELLEHQLLPRRFHAWYSRSGASSGDENDNGLSFPLIYNKLVERYPHVEKDHLVKLLKQLIQNTASTSKGFDGGGSYSAASVPTLLGTGTFSLLGHEQKKGNERSKPPPAYLRWPHMKADQVRGLSMREIGGGFSRHHRAPSIRAASYTIAKPSTMVQKMQNKKILRGHMNSVYCAIFDRSGRYVITGSDDRLVKIWSMETAYCLASCRGHEGDITDLAVSSNNALVASASNDCIIRVWRLPDGLPISVLCGHKGAVTAIAFSPRPSSLYQLLSSSDDGTCRIWDARNSQVPPRIYIARPPDPTAGKNNAPSSNISQQSHQIFCCAFNANGTVFVTGSSDNLARVWSTYKLNSDESEPNHEIDVLSGHENDVNYVQFSGCAVSSRFSIADPPKDENLPKFKNTWYNHDNIVTCSRDGSAIIWIPRSRRSHGKAGRWTRAYHLKVPPPPMSPQPTRGGPRQRMLPTPRGVNMIVWSLDNRFVLAAIMDCRICVWNAVDGSLVHSLTGHTDSTYVLDVHPFNPRMAMSAGYDGKTIVWDIWEGKPIYTYNIGVERFKLVDGKFSPDGTSIILSDNVGQLYILNTGECESQKDAKYDQFFLGDYRPLVQDENGYPLDQETQLVPYRRNMQDLLCDAGMIPYPEPYQSMYQQRRLGALGIEWRPSPVRFDVGLNITLDPNYQLLPIPDLDSFIDPLPVLLDAMDWPEIEVQSEDTDSEYNITEDCSSGRDQGSLSFNSSSDPECSSESGAEDAQNDALRRSERKKRKADGEVMTSSGRRVKRKILDEFDDELLETNWQRKSRHGHKASKKKKSSSSKSSRPRRAAARNALNFFSRITGTSIPVDGEDEEESVDDASESSSTTLDSRIGSEESDKPIDSKQKDHSKGKEVPVDESEDLDDPDEYFESHKTSGNRKRLVLKFPIRDLKNSPLVEKTEPDCDKKVDLEDSLSKSSQKIREHDENNLHDAVSTFDNGTSERIEHPKVKSYLDLSELGAQKIKWGGFKTRTPKRLKMSKSSQSNVLAGSSSGLQSHVWSKDVGTLLKKERGKNIPGESSHGGQTDEMVNGHKSCDGLQEPNYEDTASSPVPDTNGIMSHLDFKENSFPISTKLKIRSSMISRDGTRANEDVEVHDDDNTSRPWSCKAERKDLVNSEAIVDRKYNVVYRRLRSSKSKSTQVSDRSFDTNTIHASNHNVEVEMDLPEASSKGGLRARSTGLRGLTHDEVVSNGTTKSRDEHVAIDLSECEQNSLRNADNEHQCEEQRSGLRVSSGLRSTRKRRSNYHAHDIVVPEKRKAHQPGKNSWLLVSTHEEGSRYIPQLGDHVAYLRQGHEEYLKHVRSKESGPWEKIQNMRAVEFCSVKNLDYSSHIGSGEGCCKITLELVESSSSKAAESFTFTLSEMADFPDFIVERTQYDAAIRRNWTFRDKCQVWWKDPNGEDGSWWDGRITNVKPKSLEFPDSPWERYVVQYRSDPTESLLHSPWELHDAEDLWEPPHIDSAIRDKLMSSLDKLEKSGERSQDRYGIGKLKQATQRTSFINRFPVPISLEVIMSRLENNYYRTLEAVKHDILVLLSNAESYFGRNAELLTKMDRLSEWFRRTLSSL